MKITVKNYRGIESSEIIADKIALIVGNNGSGKSSIAQAVAAVLTRSPAPVGMLKKDAKQLLREGHARGSCDVDGAKISWPGGTVTAEPDAPKATLIAAGCTSPLEMKPAETSAYLSELLNAAPTLTDLTESLASMPDSLISQVWQEISAHGWDAAHKRAKESGARIKGQWEQITGEVYGSKKSSDWRPQCFAESIPEKSELEQSVNQSREKLEQLLNNVAVGKDRVEQLNQAIQIGESSKPFIKDLEESLSNLDELIEVEKKIHQEMPDPSAPVVTAKCPCCDEMLVVVSRTELIKPASKPNDDEDKIRTEALAAQVNKLNGLITKRAGIQHELNRHLNSVNIANSASQELLTIKTEGSTQEEIDAARDALAEAEYLLVMRGNIEAAEKKLKQLAQNVVIVSTLAPEGLRKQVLINVLDDVNGELKSYAMISKWGIVEITPELNVQYSGRDYRLLSESEKFRCRVSLQLYIAMIDGSSAMIIDAADILDKFGRNGLFKLLRGHPLPSVVCMTMNSVDDAPDIKKLGIGRAYWVSNNTTNEL